MLLTAFAGVVWTSEGSPADDHDNLGSQAIAVSLPVATGGVFSIRGARDENYREAPELDLPHVNGLSARFWWKSLEPERGRYDWRLLEAAAGLTIKARKQLMVVATPGIFTPDWVFRDDLKIVQLSKDDAKWLKGSATMPVPWQDSYLNDWENFLMAFGRKLQSMNLPNLYCVHIAGGGFIDEMHLPKKTESSMEQWRKHGVSEEKLDTMWKRIVTAYDRFMPPNIGLPLGLAPTIPGFNNHRTIYDWALGKYSRRVWFQQNGLSGKWTGEQEWSKMIRAAQSSTTVGYQVSEFREKSLDHQGYERAIEDGCSYVEVFSIDFFDPKLKQPLEFLAKGLSENIRKQQRR